MHTGGSRPCRKEPRRSCASRSRSMDRAENSWKPGVSWSGRNDSGNPNDLRLWRGTLGDGPTQRRFLRQGVVSAIFLIVREVFDQEPSCMPLVDDEHVIHHVSATAFDPALRDPILPETAERRSDGLDAH